MSGHVDRPTCNQLPAAWSSEAGLTDGRLFGSDMVSRAARRLDRCADEALRALARLAVDGEAERWCSAMTPALLPLLIVRCDRRPALVAEAIDALAPGAGRRLRTVDQAPEHIASPESPYTIG